MNCNSQNTIYESQNTISKFGFVNCDLEIVFFKSQFCENTKSRIVQFFWGPSSVSKKESIPHFSVFLANCFGFGQIFEIKKNVNIGLWGGR